MPGYVFEHQRRSRAAITNVKNLMHSPADPHASCDTAKMTLSHDLTCSRALPEIFPPVDPFLPHQQRRLLATASKEQEQPHIHTTENCKDFTIPRSNRSGAGSPKKRPRSPTAEDESNPRKEYIKRVKLPPTKSSLLDVDPALSPKADHAWSRSNHGTPEMKGLRHHTS
ncbi:MAG: hypothetical protein LQ344_007298 [Seirophora lacunosa]|nr:MAG: hypothetical protein LQ344_007298 [Seirophora lacunosa]